MIKSFRDRHTEAVFNRETTRRFPIQILEAARRKLVYLDAAHTLLDLQLPPGNRLEALSGDRIGQHRIRINVQWRICFVWRDGDAYDVEILDYH